MRIDENRPRFALLFQSLPNQRFRFGTDPMMKSWARACAAASSISFGSHWVCL